MEQILLPTNVERVERLNWRWNGALIEQVDEYATGSVLHSLRHTDRTRLILTLDEVGGLTERRLKPNLPCQIEHRPNSMTVAPQGVELWGAAQDLRFWRYVTVAFDLGNLEARLGEAFGAKTFENPRLRFTDPRILTLVRMLIEIPEGDRSSALLGDSLTAAIFTLLSAYPHAEQRERSLAPWQERRVKDYMREQLPRHTELQEIAALIGQSQWHFCRAFKATTGMSPYQWQLSERLKLVQQHLLSGNMPLDRIAEMTGFGDAMHLNRVFKKRTGETPGAWRRARKAKPVEDRRPETHEAL